MPHRKSLIRTLSLLFSFYLLIIMSAAKAAPITIDGILSDWTQSDRIDQQSPVSGYELYGRYENNSYKVAIHKLSGSISTDTTLWFDTDQNSSTGHLIWGFAAGVEYNVNIFSNGQPYLYTGSAGQVFSSGPLTNSIVTDGSGGSIMELDIPESLLGTPQTEIHIFMDINNAEYLPSSYSPASNSYTIAKTSSSDSITVDGSLADWTSEYRLDTANEVSGYALYGKYENNTYKIALHNLNGSLSTGTTIWLNTDKNTSTGYQIWGAYGGAEYNINIAADGLPYLYTDADGQTYVAPLSNAISSDGNTGTVMEVAIPESAINTPAGDGINIIADVNNTVFLPSSYTPDSNHYVLNKVSIYDQGKIQIDADKSDWKQSDRLDLESYHSVSDAELYGRFEDGKYKILLHHFTQNIGLNTTIWMDTDQNASTGHLIWGFAGGVEYNINIDGNGVPHLYKNNAAETYVSGPLNYASAVDGSGGSILELEVPASLIGNPSGSGINLFLDVNNGLYMPRSYSPASNNYVLPHEPNIPAIGIVYSETSEGYFFDRKAYSQLFMSAQSQAMMAGIPFDLLSETDLLDIAKIRNYKTLVIPYFPNVKSSDLATIEQNLFTAVNYYNIGIITAGNFLTTDENNVALSGDSYSRMKSIMGVTRVSGGGPVDITVNIANTSHPITSAEYTYNETLKNYTGGYTDYFTTTGSYNSAVIATQTFNGTSYPSLITVDNGGRHAHFATVTQMADTNLLWSTIQWSIYGQKAPASLQMSRNNAVFISRNDMDQSQFIDEVANVNGNLLTLLQTWKQNYNFVGSYYINVGNDAANGAYTDWAYSGPLYQQYMAIGNEIGTHSYTHPHDTNILTPAEIKFEFDDSRAVIEANMGLSNIGAAVPGAPEGLATSQEIIQYVDYLTGGYSSEGAGFNNAFGFLTPANNKVYLSPNMSFDFTLIEFKKYTAAQARQIWFDEFDELVNHNNQAIVHWPWHDYGPNDTDNQGYTQEMFTDLIDKAYQYGSEFITGQDFTYRVKTFKDAIAKVSQQGGTITADVTGTNTGQFALKVPSTTAIKSVNNWYAYDDKRVFIDNDGGQYVIQTGATPDPVTRISEMPDRSKLISLDGDGKSLNFVIQGEGKVRIKLKCSSPSIYVGGGTNAYTTIDASQIELNFTEDKLHATTYVNTSCQ